MTTISKSQLPSYAIEKAKQDSTDTLEGAKSDITPIEGGGARVSFVEGDDEEQEGLGLGAYDVKSKGHYANLVDELDEEQLMKLATIVINNISADEAARSDWMRTIEFGLDLLGVKVEEKHIPFEGACSAQHPLLMESAVKFQSKASNELLPANGPVKTKILGDVTLEKEDQANRVKNHMNYQITEEMTEFYPDTERMLLYLPLVGSGFKKHYYNGHLERPCSEFVPTDQFIVPNSAPDLFRADRYTHVLTKSDYQLEADCEAGLYMKPADGFGVPKEAKLNTVQKKTQELIGIKIGMGDRDKVFTLLEQHIMIHIEGLDERGDKKFKLASPYVITVEEGSQKVIGIRRCWKEGDEKRKKKVQFTHYTFVPSFQFYGFGFLHLLGNLQLSLTSALRSLVDAGQFATLQGGFKLKGVRIVDDGSPIYPGQFKDLECAIQDINKAIMPLPFKEPSQTLYQMLEFLDQKGQKFADSTEQVIADSTNYGPVGTTMALLEASTKFFSAIHKRLHASLKNELQAIAAINAETLPDNLDYNIENQTSAISRKDYDDRVDVVPVSDPNISSSAHRMAKAQTLLEIALKTPEVHDMREVLKHVYINMDYPNIDKILPPPEQAQQQDPLSDIKAAVGGQPIKAFEGQDHKAHIAIKQAFLMDPMSGQNPMMQKASMQIQANVQEHMMLGFTEQVQAQMQMQTQGQQIAPEMQQQAMGQAAQQVAQMNQQNLQNQLDQAKQQSGSAVKDQATMMLAHAELQDTQTQRDKAYADAKFNLAKLELEREKEKNRVALELHKTHTKMDMELHKEHNKLQTAGMKHQGEMEKIVTTKGIDATIAGLSQSYEKKHEQDMAYHQGEIDKSVERAKPRPTKGPSK